tara:strand:+ start:28871 stop:29041 length:171 start_codon:yes stop_codon:yes gene_type:complete
MERLVFFIGLTLFILGIAGCSFHEGNTEPMGWAAFIGFLMMSGDISWNSSRESKGN